MKPCPPDPEQSKPGGMKPCPPDPRALFSAQAGESEHSQGEHGEGGGFGDGRDGRHFDVVQLQVAGVVAEREAEIILPGGGHIGSEFGPAERAGIGQADQRCAVETGGKIIRRVAIRRKPETHLQNLAGVIGDILRQDAVTADRAKHREIAAILRAEDR